MALYGKNYDICKLLITNGADMNAKLDCELSVLLVSIDWANKILSKLLIDSGAEIEIGDEAFNKMKEKGWIDLCLELMRNKSFGRKKHLIKSYYSY